MTHDPFRRGQFGFTRMRIRKVSGWQLALIAAVAVALVLTLTLVAAGAFLLLFPVVLIGGLIWRIMARWRGASPIRPQQSDSRQDNIIDAEYVILTDKSKEEQ